jgi:hypothetical protein
MCGPLETLPVETVTSDSNCQNFPFNVVRFFHSIPLCAPWQITFDWGSKRLNLNPTHPFRVTRIIQQLPDSW